MLEASDGFHGATDAGHEIASLTAGVISGNMGEAERETIRKLGDLAVQAAGFLTSLGTPEAQAAVTMLLTSLGVC